MGETVTGRKVFLDNTVLTNFALIGRPDLILLLWPDIACTTTSIMEEYQAGVYATKLPENVWHELPIYKLTTEENARATGLPPQLGTGERTCLAAAIIQQGVLASDDQQARKYGLQVGVTIIGSVGILIRCIEQGLISKSEAQVLLDRMIAANYHSPISSLDEILD
jgi:predicted nucleic acid-binding protein